MSGRASRELAALTDVFNQDGRRGMLDTKDPTRDLSLSARMVELFHSGQVPPPLLLAPVRSAAHLPHTV
jgi:hypothetical protein